MTALSYGFASGWGLGLIMFAIHYIYYALNIFRSGLCNLKVNAQVH